MTPQILGTLAVVVGLASFVPYLYLIVCRQIRPHAISFFIWALSTLAVGLAQLVGGAGPGAWATLGFSGFCALFAVLAVFYHGEKTIYRSDWACLALALFGLALWPLTQTPLWSVLILTLVDAAGYVPTYRKTYRNPREESGTLYFLGSVSFGLSIMALETFSLVTLFYPVVISIFNLAVVGLVVWPRLKARWS